MHVARQQMSLSFQSDGAIDWHSVRRPSSSCVSLCHNGSLVSSRRLIAFLFFCCVPVRFLTAQASDEEFRVYKEHPRLFLTQQRLRLLKRERERDSLRWRQLDALIKGAAQMPEPGFAAALYFAISGDAAQGKRAIDWALGPGTDLRQLALVYDWCQPLLNPQQSQTLDAKIRRIVAQMPAAPPSLPAQRDRVLAVIATADENQHGEEKVLRPAVEQWWRAELAPALTAGKTTIPLHELNALIEILHAMRDTLKVEFEEAAPQYFRELPLYQLLGNYPAPLAGPENEYWVPVYKEASEPNLDLAALARAGDLSLVAYDNNALENQYLQGWLMQDRFMLRSAFGAPYEFLWANPYQPGLAYTQLPSFFHDKNSGVFFARASWDDDAIWFGLYEGEEQLFQDGKITVLTRGLAPSRSKPIQLGAVSIVPGADPLQFSLAGSTTLVIGLKPQRKYAVEIDDQEMREVQTDPAGTLALENPGGRTDAVRIHESGVPGG